jgi:ATP-dependent Clp protease ATP-binding subunit ClpC
MTSNIGSRELKEFGEGIGFAVSTGSSSIQRTQSIVDRALQRKFSPEFLNRIDDRIMFNKLTKENISDILDIELDGLMKRLHELGYSVSICDGTRAKVVEEGYDPDYGARPLKRAIQRLIEDPLAERIIAGEVPDMI